MSTPVINLYARKGRTYKAEATRAIEQERRQKEANDTMAPFLGIQKDTASSVSTASALDYFSNPAARNGLGTPSLNEDTQYILDRLSNNYQLMLTLYRNHWISRRICDVPSRDIVRAWPTLISDISPEDTTRLDRCIRETNTKKKIYDALRYARLFGGTGAVMMIDGHEDRLAEPLDVDEIELGAYRGLLPFDRWSGIQPLGGVSTDFLNPMGFNLPEYYSIQAPGGGPSLTVHASRVLRFSGPEVPDPEYSAQNWWGISALEVAYEEIRKCDNLSWNLLGLSFRANILELKSKTLESAMSGATMSNRGLVELQGRMQAFNHMLSSQSLVITGADGGLSSTNYQPAGWDAIYGLFQMAIAGAAEIPVTRLFGRTINGLGSSNDGEEKVYEERISSEQDTEIRPQLDRLYPVICMSVLGEVPDDLDLKFPSIRVPDEKEKSDLANSMCTGIVAVYGAGIITKVMALKELKQGSAATGMFSNISDEDIAATEKEEKLQKKAQQLGLAKPVVEGESEETPGGKGHEEEGRKEGDPDFEESFEEEQTLARDSAYSAGLTCFDFSGLPLAIEYPQGSQRKIVNPDGVVVYDRTMLYDYGFIRATVGRDGDEIDVIVGPNEDAPYVYIVDMIDLGFDVDQREDEDKVCLGFNSESAALRAFQSMYPPSFFGGMKSVSIKDFRHRMRVVARDSSSISDSDFSESDHPRSKGGEHGGEFVKKGSGGSAATGRGTRAKGSTVTSPSSFKLAPQATIRPIVESKLVELRGADIPTGWLSAKSNPDPKADITYIGTNDAGNRAVRYSKLFYEKQKVAREEWPDWAKAAKVPPIWTEIKLATGPDSKILATGVDTTGKRKALYSPEWERQQHAKKHARVKKLEAGIDKVYSRIERDRKSPDVEVRQQAICNELILKYGVRPGGSLEQKGKEFHYGATTLRAQHIVQDGRNGKLYVRFIGKSGKANEYQVDDPILEKQLLKAKSEALQNRKDNPSDPAWKEEWLFPWTSASGLTKYNQEIGKGAGFNFKTKDFRTRVGTNQARTQVAEMKAPKTAREFKQKRDAVGDYVASKLNNTRAPALKAYIERSVFGKWFSGLSEAEQEIVNEKKWYPI